MLPAYIYATGIGMVWYWYPTVPRLLGTTTITTGVHWICTYYVSRTLRLGLGLRCKRKACWQCRESSTTYINTSPTEVDYVFDTGVNKTSCSTPFITRKTSITLPYPLASLYLERRVQYRQLRIESFCKNRKHTSPLIILPRGVLSLLYWLWLWLLVNRREGSDRRLRVPTCRLWKRQQ